MNKKQIEAMAWMVVAGSINTDMHDVVNMLTDIYADMPMTEQEKLEIAEKASDIKFQIQNKAGKVWDKAFSKRI